jgi:hypothetical protein
MRAALSPERVAKAGKGLGETRAYALMPQPETGKISCAHRLPYARLSPGVCNVECSGSENSSEGWN